VDVTGVVYAFAPLNAAAFALRKKMAWSRGRVEHANEAKNDLFAYADEGSTSLALRERELRERYELARLFASSSCSDYRENLYLLDLLDRHAGAHARRAFGGQPRIRALDVGSKDFRYAFGLAHWLRHGTGGPSRDVALTGIELDGHPIYADLHSRKDHADAYAREVDRATVDYLVKDVLEHEEREVDLVFLFFPFVLEYALLRWGLPRRCFLPQRILRHVRTLLRPGGLVVVMNHTEAEHRRQLELLTDAGFDILSTARAESALVDYALDVPERTITIARRR